MLPQEPSLGTAEGAAEPSRAGHRGYRGPGLRSEAEFSEEGAMGVCVCQFFIHFSQACSIFIGNKSDYSSSSKDFFSL